MVRLRRASRLGGEPHGDSDAPAFATTVVQQTPLISSSAPSPYSKKAPTKTRIQANKQGGRSAWQRYYTYARRHTWLTPLLLVLIILSAYLVHPTESNPLHAAIFLSYPLPKTKTETDGPTMYGKGVRDFAFVAFYTVVLSFAREFLMQRVIYPLGLYCGICSRSKIARFMEQLYAAMYFSVFIPLGLYVMSRSSVWYFNTTSMFQGYPHREHEGLLKAYYLLQASYWAQQAAVLILQLEKPRKDFRELVAHHIITLTLIWLSYRFHFMHMGLAVYISHDISDFFLATSRILNYLDSVFVGPFYGTFVVVWIYTRHYINLRILWAVLTEFATVGPYKLDWETQQYKCWISQVITFVLLAGLQALNLFWLFLILRVLWNYVATRVPRDETSDTEEEEEEGHHGGSSAWVSK
ncbi:hypothetical protein A1O3_06842 [Capronia epimyces CBS 606.96]|uniref:TLC domain-containing protein n=1 Tax=Capronia epimyces CBS 606.96 TaxID=1182542 RepID=W9Y064_9EURO|nr:uncharacterized protein A1O3_06842 [Capronia epimyces CBS 606.96]EXJ83025.1 hypothetical protein A1O3_06842 [Capronia epimyces CBS 606.96]